MTDSHADLDTFSNGSVHFRWNAATRVVVIHFASDVHLTARDGAFFEETLTRCVGSGGAPFGVLAHAGTVEGTDADYRAALQRFYRAHRDSAFHAALNMTPTTQTIAEMFRVAIGAHLEIFTDEAAARAWLRANGIAA